MKTCITKTVTPYEDLMIQRLENKNLKQIACCIILSAIEDADIEFLTDDYEEWKTWRNKRKKRSEVLNELDYKLEFKGKQDYKDALFSICDVYVRVSDIPQKTLDERRMYETSCMKDLIKKTNYKKETLLNVSKLHGWKIGVDYVEPTMFDDNF